MGQDPDGWASTPAPSITREAALYGCFLSHWGRMAQPGHEVQLSRRSAVQREGERVRQPFLLQGPGMDSGHQRHILRQIKKTMDGFMRQSGPPRHHH